MLKLSTFEVRTCRKCLGLGCIHCDHEGTYRVPLYRKIDPSLARARSVLPTPARNNFASESEKVLAFLRAA